MISKYRVYIDDPSEAPDDADVQQGPQGGYYYERETGQSSGETPDDPMSHVDPEHLAERYDISSPEGGEYDVDTEFGGRVADAVNGGEVVERVAANEWMSNAGAIEDDDLLLDALKQIEEDGTKTARERVRRRLRGIGWDEEKIDEHLRETSGPNRERLNIEDTVSDWSLGTNAQPTTAINEEAMRLAENATTEQLEQFVEDRTEGVENILQMDDMELTQLLQEVDTDTLKHFARAIGEGDLVTGDNVEVTGLAVRMEDVHRRELVSRLDDDDFNVGTHDDPKTKFAKAVLWHRGDANYDVDDFIDFENADRTPPGQLASIEGGIEDAMSKMHPGIASIAAASLRKIEIDPTLDPNGRHTGAAIIVDPTSKTPHRTTAHEFGHHTHNKLGFDKRWNTYPDYDEFMQFGRDDAVFGIQSPPAGDLETQETFDELKKIRKNWQRYRDGETGEMRSYERRHGVEYLAVSFAHWSRDEAMLQRRDPYMKHFWDKHGGGATEVEDPDDLQEGDELILDEGRPQLYEVDKKSDGGLRLKPKGVGGTSSDTIGRPWYHIEDTFDGGVRHD